MQINPKFNEKNRMITFTNLNLKNSQERKLQTASSLVPRFAALTFAFLGAKETSKGQKSVRLRFYLGHDTSSKQHNVS